MKYNLCTRKEITVIVRSGQSASLAEMEQHQVARIPEEGLDGSDVIILSVKPQDFSVLAEQLHGKIKPDQIVLSVMAGITIEQIQSALDHINVVRAMPNAAIELGMGMTVFCSSTEVKMEHLRKVEQLLSTTGRTVYLEDENKMDAVTALSGSGPAYFYYIVQSMIEAGRKMGFDESISSMLVKQTMLGAFHLLNSTDKSLDDLIATVASKGGTTQAAINEFEKGALKETLIRGILRAEERGRELSAELKKH